jgi:hypothetical protein
MREWLVAVAVAGCRSAPPAEEPAAPQATVAAAAEEAAPPPAAEPAPAETVAPAPEPSAAEPAPPSSPPAPTTRPACVFEQSEPWPRPSGGGLGTKSYPPTEAEKPFFEKLFGDAPMGMAASESMPREVGKSVSWFGIVRGIRVDAARGETRLLLENKYFDGMTDTHILCVSFVGGGDFVAVLAGAEHPVKPLALVRVYGKVVAVKDDVPRVDAEYVRHFDQGTYCFMFVEGTPAGNQTWRELCQVEDDDIYSPFPNEAYYAARLGPRTDFAPGKVEVPQD